MSDNLKTMEELTRVFLDINDLGGRYDFDDTPKRVARMWDRFFNVEKPNLHAFPTDSNEMVVVKGFTLWGYCPHHLVPVRYTYKIGYIPRKKALGLSKFVRLARWQLKSLPLQEDIPVQLAKELEAVLDPLGLGVQVEGYHLCMVMRGVEQANSTVVSTALTGLMLHSPATRDEFLRA